MKLDLIPALLLGCATIATPALAATLLSGVNPAYVDASTAPGKATSEVRSRIEPEWPDFL